jgi:hypothetical protein
MPRSGSISTSEIVRRVYGERLVGMGSAESAIAAGSSLPRLDGALRHRVSGPSVEARETVASRNLQAHQVCGMRYAIEAGGARLVASVSPSPQLRDTRVFPILAGKSGTLAEIERSPSLRAIGLSSSVLPAVIVCCLDNHQADSSRHSSPYSDLREDCPMSTITTEEGRRSSTRIVVRRTRIGVREPRIGDPGTRSRSSSITAGR